MHNNELTIAPETKALGDDVTGAFDEFMHAFEAFKESNDDRLGQIEKRMGADVLTTEKVDRISRAMDEQKRAMDQLTLKAARPPLGRDGKAQAGASEHKAAFVGRYETPQFLSEMSDVVISHQWENPLNYFYLEVCWQGYPLVHNANMCQDLGYYYAQNDVQAGCRQLLHAMARHDEHWEAYRARQRQLIARYLPDHPSVVAQYQDLLLQLMQQAPI